MNELLNDNSGGLSTTRVVTVGGMSIVFAIFIASAFGWATFPVIPESVLWLVGLLISGKVVQRFGEKANG